MTTDLFRIDENRTYHADLNEFLKVVKRRVQIPLFVTADSEGRQPANPHQIVIDYAQKYLSDEGKVNYKSMIEDLVSFDYIKA